MNNSEFLQSIQAQLSKQYKEITTNYYSGAVTGSESAFEKSAEAQFEYEKILSDKDNFTRIVSCTTDNSLSSIEKRIAEVLLNESKAKQVDNSLLKEMIDKQTEIEKLFTEFRVVIDGKKITDNEVENVLSNSSNSEEVKVHWEESKIIGEIVSNKLIDLIKLRNKSAQKLGYNNYHEMQLILSEINPEWLLDTFDKLDELTSPTFERMKSEIDSHLSAKFNIDKS